MQGGAGAWVGHRPTVRDVPLGFAASEFWDFYPGVVGEGDSPTAPWVTAHPLSGTRRPPEVAASRANRPDRNHRDVGP